ncbi:hypothetical protein [Sphingobium sp. YR768]|uniref:hypothetical protein n=1 Tax=Sphingobium sp. YR768 TaxID=1884365 RepID=UPI0008AEE22F|nr:hypothetical protein [Sphingobium sp. YR768]SES11408.1 hypothetical protein SAMN05518866_14021 [Sphingobium sp. YR768]
MTAGMEQRAAIATYIAREAIVSAVINAAIGALFFYGLFGGLNDVPVPGWGGYAFDFLPQSAAVTLMACLVPGLLARRALAAGRWRLPQNEVPALPYLLRLAALSVAVGLMLGGGSAALWIMSGIVSLGHASALVIKIVYGALLGALITSRVLRHLLRDTLSSKDMN